MDITNDDITIDDINNLIKDLQDYIDIKNIETNYNGKHVTHLYKIISELECRKNKIIKSKLLSSVD